MGMSLRYAPRRSVNCPLQGTIKLAHKRTKLHYLRRIVGNGPLAVILTLLVFPRFFLHLPHRMRKINISVKKFEQTGDS